MPARMWKRGIHSFFKVLRRRHPDSQDYTLAFIYLAYQMVALLSETDPSFTDTWIECLCDLARYRMAIEEEKEVHSAGGDVAARWYTIAADRQPCIGQLYHHPVVLKHPSLRRLYIYVKSLAHVAPFPRACDLPSTICGPIVQDGQSDMQKARAQKLRRLWLQIAFHNKHLLHSERNNVSRTDVTPSPAALTSSSGLSKLGNTNLGITRFAFGKRKVSCIVTADAASRSSWTIRVLSALAKLFAAIHIYTAFVALGSLPCADGAVMPYDRQMHRSDSAAQPSSTEDMFDQIRTIEQIGLRGLAFVAATWAVCDCSLVVARGPKVEPKFSGELAIGCGLILWGLVETVPDHTDLRNLIVSIWVASEVHYVARMCCIVKDGRAYFWSSVTLGLFSSMFMAALQSEGRPTLATMILTALPSMATFISCAARILPAAIGIGQ